jgi:MFS family permease
VRAVEPGERFGPLYLGSFIAYGDRFLIGPVLVVIADDFDVSLGAAAAVATLYLFLYGVLQPVYGVLSDRFGRVRVMRAALTGIVAAKDRKSVV